MKPKSAGMTLIELMIVVAIVALLAAIAVPSYRQYVLRANRTEATTALLQLAAAQEKFYLQNNTYAGNALIDTAPPAGLGLSATTDGGRYTVAITAANAAAFSATATAAGAQAADATCATFTINQAGARTATSADCW
jgi:type IV pilus assembly protein PilE